MRKRIQEIVLIIALLLAAYFDHRTMILWVVGCGQGCLLAWRYGAWSLRTILEMILANCFYVWLLLLGFSSIAIFEDQQYYNVDFLGIALALVVAVGVWWPFCYWALRENVCEGQPLWLRSLRASFLVQTATLLLVAIWYGCVALLFRFGFFFN